jgi:hypothetical protein
VRVALWNLFESKTTIDELREQLPGGAPPSAWIWNEAPERFRLVLLGHEVPGGLSRVRELIGRDPDVFEEFDMLD